MWMTLTLVAQDVGFWERIAERWGFPIVVLTAMFLGIAWIGRRLFRDGGPVERVAQAAVDYIQTGKDLSARGVALQEQAITLVTGHEKAASESRSQVSEILHRQVQFNEAAARACDLLEIMCPDKKRELTAIREELKRPRG